jgi:hypothetical protein
MRIGVAHQPVAIQHRAAPVHRRVRREAGLDSENLAGQIAVAVRNQIEAGFGAKDREPGRPNVRRDKIAARAAIQNDLQEIARVEAKDRPAVGRQIADLR